MKCDNSPFLCTNIISTCPVSARCYRFPRQETTCKTDPQSGGVCIISGWPHSSGLGRRKKSGESDCLVGDTLWALVSEWGYNGLHTYLLKKKHKQTIIWVSNRMVAIFVLTLNNIQHVYIWNFMFQHVLNLWILGLGFQLFPQWSRDTPMPDFAFDRLMIQVWGCGIW